MGQQDSSNQNDPKTRQVAICRTCLAEDGVSNSKVLKKMISHPMLKNHYPRMVCAACWERGRETPVTCRTFVPSADR
jgi:hypothetical protein